MMINEIILLKLIRSMTCMVRSHARPNHTKTKLNNFVPALLALLYTLDGVGFHQHFTASVLLYTLGVMQWICV